ncbi:MAG: hypothetical protein KUG83_06705 [Gammaproteobacteria bacterium]|nr:hypothetical protein [Gammaproteobacteria bacterium]
MEAEHDGINDSASKNPQLPNKLLRFIGSSQWNFSSLLGSRVVIENPSFFRNMRL